MWLCRGIVSLYCLRRGTNQKVLGKTWPKIASPDFLHTKNHWECKSCASCTWCQVLIKEMDRCHQQRESIYAGGLLGHIWHNWAWKASEQGLPKQLQTSLCCLTYTVTLRMSHEALSTRMLPTEKYTI